MSLHLPFELKFSCHVGFCFVIHVTTFKLFSSLSLSLIPPHPRPFYSKSDEIFKRSSQDPYQVPVCSGNRHLHGLSPVPAHSEPSPKQKSRSVQGLCPFAFTASRLEKSSPENLAEPLRVPGRAGLHQVRGLPTLLQTQCPEPVQADVPGSVQHVHVPPRPSEPVQAEE